MQRQSPSKRRHHRFWKIDRHWDFGVCEWTMWTSSRLNGDQYYGLQLGELINGCPSMALVSELQPRVSYFFCPLFPRWLYHNSSPRSRRDHLASHTNRSMWDQMRFFYSYLSTYIRTLVVHMLPRRSPHHFLSLHLDHSEVRREFRTAWICVQVTYIHVVLEVIFLTSLCIAGRTRFLIAEFVRWPAWQRFYSPLMRMDFNLLYFV